MTAPRPALRPEIDAVPTRQQGETFFVLYDRSGLTAAQLAVSPVVMFVAARLDGTRSLLDIQDEYATETGGEHLDAEQLQQLIGQFDNALFLQGKRFDAYYREELQSFQSAPIREASSAGSAYSDDPDELERDLDEMLRAAPPPEENAARETDAVAKGLIVPHIDFARGAAGYAQAYAELSRRTPPEAVIILGTAHQAMTNRFCLCDKDFSLPGGIMRCERDLTRRILETCRPEADFTEDLFLHRGEHSVELQLLWIRHVWGGRVPVVAVLCDGIDFDPAHAASNPPHDDPQRRAFAQAVRQILAERPGILLLASVDLAHVGPRFGDGRDVDEALLEETEAADRDYLQAVASGEPQAGLDSLNRHGDRYHICGAGAIHTLGLCLPGVKGRLLGYHQSASPEMQQAVTYAAMTFE